VVDVTNTVKTERPPDTRRDGDDPRLLRPRRTSPCTSFSVTRTERLPLVLGFALGAYLVMVEDEVIRDG